VNRNGSERTGATRWRVIVVGENAIATEGMAAIISRDPRFEVIARASGYLEAENLTQRRKPEIIVMEPFLEDRDGILWIKDLKIQLPKTSILVVSGHSEETYAERALRAGAAGYLMKHESADELLWALEVVASGEQYVSSAIAARALRHLIGTCGGRQRKSDCLSDRELHIFSLIAQGAGITQIAKTLGRSRKTVETHCEHIKLKLGYTDAQQLKRGAHELLGENP
jgi:DNA-binding NarL/FixJ family response regulator